jgi:hypothetical protein
MVHESVMWTIVQPLNRTIISKTTSQKATIFELFRIYSFNGEGFSIIEEIESPSRSIIANLSVEHSIFRSDPAQFIFPLIDRTVHLESPNLAQLSPFIPSNRLYGRPTGLFHEKLFLLKHNH